MIRRVLEAINEEVDDVAAIELALKQRGWRKVKQEEDSIEKEMYDTERNEVYYDNEPLIRSTWEGPYEGMTVTLEEEDYLPGASPRYLMSARVTVENPLNSGQDLPLLRSKFRLERKYSELVAEHRDGILNAIRRLADQFNLKRKKR